MFLAFVKQFHIKLHIDIESIILNWILFSLNYKFLKVYFFYFYIKFYPLLIPPTIHHATPPQLLLPQYRLQT